MDIVCESETNSGGVASFNEREFGFFAESGRKRLWEERRCRICACGIAGLMCFVFVFVFFVYKERQALDEFCRVHSSKPRAWNASDADEVVSLANAMLPFAVEDSLFGKITTTHLDVPIVRAISFTSVGMLHPLCAFLGGAVAQEAQKAVTGKFTPQQQVKHKAKLGKRKNSFMFCFCFFAVGCFRCT
jgi:hypothetical protein